MATIRTAALYMRMSTERQDYSIKHQRHALEIYAAANNITVVREYCDEGKSGLALKGRDGLRQLLDDVVSTQAPFNTLMVYDVSRWGRFQDVDEAAHYEFLCRSAGITVLYCAEQFQNDGSALSSMVKTIKRAMAAEYSRELSEKVFKAQCRFARLGFKQGGSAGFGLRRVSVTTEGEPRCVLAPGERKRSVTDRVIYARGPAHEVAVVRQIYRWFVHDRLTYDKIVRTLNKRGIKNERGTAWTPWMVKSILSNEKYAGNLVFNKRSSKLGSGRVVNGADLHIRHEQAFPSVVSPKLFRAAQIESDRRLRVGSNEELLAHLRGIHGKHGRLTSDLVNLEPGPSDNCYRKRFRTMANAFALAGAGDNKYRLIAQTKVKMAEMMDAFTCQAVELAQLAGAKAQRAAGRSNLLINDEVRVRLVISRRQYPKETIPRWRVVLRYAGQPHFLLIAQLDDTNTFIQAYYLMPMAGYVKTHVWLRDEPRNKYFKYRYQSLEDILSALLMQTGASSHELKWRRQSTA